MANYLYAAIIVCALGVIVCAIIVIHDLREINKNLYRIRSLTNDYRKR